MRLTPGTLKAVSRAIVTSTSGEIVVLSGEEDSFISFSPVIVGRLLLEDLQ
jgi:hypothetical protein